MKDAFGRVARAPHPDLHRLLYAPALADDLREVLPLLVRINAAHVVMLERCGLMVRLAAAAVLKAGAAIAAEPPPTGMARGLYAWFEGALIERCGPDVGGAVHAGRSRNDINATVARLRVRGVVMALLEDLLDLQAAVLGRAVEHRSTVMPGFTHLQPAQPTTFGHYLLGVAAELNRAADRLLDIDRRLDACPMGACAGFGTGMPIQPELVASLLGFERPVASSVDAVASRDYVVDFLSAAAITGTTLTRLATDLQLWSSAAVGWFDWPDDLVSTSSIMPQKRNAFVLESIRGRSTDAAGEWVAAVIGLKNTPFTNTIEVSSDVVERAPRAAHHTRTAVQLMTLLVKSLIVRTDRLQQSAHAGDTTATALADALVRGCQVPFRTAHEAVASLMMANVDRGDPAAVAGYLQHAVSRPVHPNAIAGALDPLAVVAGAAFGGGPAAPSLARQQAELESSLDAHRRRLVARRAMHTAAEDALHHAIDQLTSAV